MAWGGIMSYNKPYFDSIQFDGNLDNGISLHLHCPICGEGDKSVRHWESVNTGKLAASLPTNFDYNGLRTFTVARHDDTLASKGCAGSGLDIKLYVAVHKVRELIKWAISESPIENNWWVNLEDASV